MTIVFFTDRDLGKLFPAVLRDAGLTVERHADHFSPTTPDEEWLAETARRGWVAITHDRRIRYKPNELEAVAYHNVGLLVVIGAAPHGDLARSFVVTAPRIISFIEVQQRPFIAKVYRGPASTPSRSSAVLPGRVELWYPALSR